MQHSSQKLILFFHERTNSYYFLSITRSKTQPLFTKFLNKNYTLLVIEQASFHNFFLSGKKLRSKTYISEGRKNNSYFSTRRLYRLGVGSLFIRIFNTFKPLEDFDTEMHKIVFNTCQNLTKV